MDQYTRDLVEITALVHRYARLMDGGDLDGLSSLFAHATMRSDSVPGVLRGSAEIRRIYDQVVLYDGSPRTNHVITNLSIELGEDGNRATAHSYFTVLQGVRPGEPIQVVTSGRYEDRFERANGAWRFSERVFHVDLVGDMSSHLRGLSLGH